MMRARRMDSLQYHSDFKASSICRGFLPPDKPSSPSLSFCWTAMSQPVKWQCSKSKNPDGIRGHKVPVLWVQSGRMWREELPCHGKGPIPPPVQDGCMRGRCHGCQMGGTYTNPCTSKYALRAQGKPAGRTVGIYSQIILLLNEIESTKEFRN